MTLIVTTITNLGIVQAADSNLSSGGASAGTGRKVFRLDGFDGVVALTGRYGVGGVRMDTWLPDVISDYPTTTASATVPGFAQYLCDRLNAEFGYDPGARLLLHVSGYVDGAAGIHPEMWFVRNVSTINADGSYGVADAAFQLSEEFWNRDHLAYRGTPGDPRIRALLLQRP